MIQELTVENIAIIDQAMLTFGAGFSALTGETGAGKSLLVDSIGLALGNRADTELVRTGCNRGSVHLVADLRANPIALAKCAELGVEMEDGILVVQRTITTEGRSTVRLNGKPVAVGSLKEIGRFLIDLHGQHDNQSLLNPEKQLDFLDSWIGDDAAHLIVQISEQYAQVESLKRKLNHLRNSQREREQRIDMLKFQIEEIESAGLSANETESLNNLLGRLKNSERLLQATGQHLQTLSDDEGSALERVSAALREFESLGRLDSELEPIFGQLQAAEAALTESLRDLRHYQDALDLDPEALEETAARLDLIARLKRKYGEDELAILNHLEESQRELSDLESGDYDEESLVSALEEQSKQLEKLSHQLSELRKGKATKFSQEVQAHVRDLAMEKAEFSVQFTEIPIQPNGLDAIEFYFTSNPGEPQRSMARVASGGEISRVMLAIKVASAGRAGVPTLIFDEVDTGLSGRAAAITAKKLEQLSQHNQVMVITHLPQIAGRANTHFHIEKQTASGRTQTVIHELTGDE
ncbi:MAG: DNA repair protein RecN, partial [Armatimonadetes bacterium]|nr:DNA repair protein RecN [Armatimonadota bacterium]